MRRWGIEADDVVHCFDAATGVTLWKTAFVASGITLGSWTKCGGLPAPCYADGRIYILGSGCRVSAVDAKTGAALWHSNVGIRAEYQSHYTRLSCKNRAVPYFNRDLGSAVVEADGVVACVDHVSHYRGPRYGCGLVGFDGATGRRLWHIDECTAWWGMPLKWSANGKEYIVSPGGERGATCIEPKTGKILWELRGRAGGQMCLVSGDLLLVNGGGGVTCFRMSPTGAIMKVSLWDPGPEGVRPLDTVRVAWALRFPGLRFAPADPIRHASTIAARRTGGFMCGLLLPSGPSPIPCYPLRGV